MKEKFLKNWFLNDLSMILAIQRVTDLNKSLAIPLLEKKIIVENLNFKIKIKKRMPLDKEEEI